MPLIELPKLYHPDFAQPGKKPIGPVDVDTRHSINHKRLFLFNSLRGELAVQPAAALVGTQEFSAGLGGIGLTGGSAASDYFDTNSKVTGFFGGLAITDVVQFSLTSAARSYVFGVANDGSGFIDDFALNFDENETESAGRSFRFLRDTSGQLIRAATDDLGLNDGAVHTVVWTKEQGDVLVCHADGAKVNITYGAQAAQTAYPDNAGYDYWVGTRNLRGVGQLGSNDLRIYMWDRICGAVPDSLAKSLSTDPHQILKPATAQMYAFPSAAGGGVSVEIPTLDNSATTYAPTISISDHQTIEIPTSAHSITTYAPTITIGDSISVEIPTLDNSATTYAPTITISDNISIEIPTLDNSATTYSPIISISGNVSIEIPTSEHAITTYAPDVSVTNHITIEIPVSLHKITTYAPRIQIGGTPAISLNLESLITVTDNCLMPITPIQTLTAHITDDETTATCLMREQKPLPTRISSAELTNYANIEPEINLVATMRG